MAFFTNSILYTLNPFQLGWAWLCEKYVTYVKSIKFEIEIEIAAIKWQTNLTFKKSSSKHKMVSECHRDDLRIWLKYYESDKKIHAHWRAWLYILLSTLVNEVESSWGSRCLQVVHTRLRNFHWCFIYFSLNKATM